MVGDDTTRDTGRLATHTLRLAPSTANAKEPETYLLETKFSPRGLTSTITRNTSSANIWPNFINKACRAYAYFTGQRGASRAFAAHAALISCYIVAGDQIQIVISFRGEPGPLG